MAKRQPRGFAPRGKRRKVSTRQLVLRRGPASRQRAYRLGAGEMKFHDLAVTDGTIAQNGVIQTTGTINIIPQGVTEVQRVGRKCTVTKIQWRWNVVNAGGAAVGTSETVRLIVYLDKQCNGATAAVTDILETDDYQSFRNLSNTGRFVILYDYTVTLNPQASAGNGTANDTATVAENGTFYKDCNIPIEFSSTTGALTEIRSNNLAVMTVAKEGNLATLDSEIRLRFGDG